jgi:hypothetical protein
MSTTTRISVAGLSGRLPHPLARVTLAVRYGSCKVALVELPTGDLCAPDESCTEVYRRSLEEFLEALEIWKKSSEPIA